MSQKGFSPIIVIGIAAAVIALSGGLYFFDFFAGQNRKFEETPSNLNETVSTPAKEDREPDPITVKKESPVKQTQPAPVISVPETLPAKSSPLAPLSSKLNPSPPSQPVNFQSTCTNNPSPVFTHHITDMSQVAYVVPPPTMGAGPSLKPHSYIGTNHARVPIYAPTALTLRSGTHYVGGPYVFDLSASCEVKVRFGHITEPVEAIKNLLPSEPKSGSQDQELSPLKFTAGQLLGYTTGTTAAGNWDFGVYNSATSNRYASDPSWNNSSVYTTAVCPFGYFVPELKAEYVSKFDSKILSGNPPHGESFCL